jgi:protein arginine kinase activator
MKQNSEKNLDLLMTMIENLTQKYYNNKCTRCECTYQDILKKSRLGCDLCYDNFKPEISIMIGKCQVSTTHVGKRPKFTNKHNYNNMINTEIDVLEKLMKEAASLENYEYASELKERIKKLQDKKAQNEI